MYYSGYIFTPTEEVDIALPVLPPRLFPEDLSISGYQSAGMEGITDEELRRILKELEVPAELYLRFILYKLDTLSALLSASDTTLYSLSLPIDVLRRIQLFREERKRNESREGQEETSSQS